MTRTKSRSELLLQVARTNMRGKGALWVVPCVLRVAVFVPKTRAFLELERSSSEMSKSIWPDYFSALKAYIRKTCSNSFKQKTGINWWNVSRKKCSLFMSPIWAAHWHNHSTACWHRESRCMFCWKSTIVPVLLAPGAMMIRKPSEWGHGAIGWNMISAPFATRQVFELKKMYAFFFPLFLQFWLAVGWCQLETRNPWRSIHQGRHVPVEPPLHPSGMFHRGRGLEWCRRRRYVGMSENGIPVPVRKNHDE